jgi:hypothetical protein
MTNHLSSTDTEYQPYYLPKSYLSWTQLDTWRKSPDTYVKYYMENKPRPTTAEMAFGKKSAEGREKGDTHEIPKELQFEYPEFEFLTFVNGIKCIGAADAMSRTYKEFREDKTGVTPWTMKRVHGHDQLVFYAMLTFYQTGIVPERAHVLWLPTKKNKPVEHGGLWNKADNPIIERAGEPVYFTREFDLDEIIRMRADTVRAARQISDRYVKFIADQI